MTELTPSEKTRYSRHLILPEVGEPGQCRLKEARVAVAGAGGLGSPVALYLAAAGVGCLGIIDFDEVDLSNLQRQVLYTVGDIKSSKAEKARERLVLLNPEIEVNSHEVRLQADNVMETIAGYDLVVDGTDNFSTRYLINDACVLSGKPNVYGSIYRFEGQLSVFCAEGGPCYRCLFPDPPEPYAVPNCAEGGVLGVLAGVIGTLQATEAIKLIIGEGEPLIGRLLLYNALEMEFHRLKVKRKDDCPACGSHPTITRPMDQEVVCAAPAASSTMGGAKEMMTITEIEAKDLEKVLKDKPNEIVLLDVRNDTELAICKLDGAIHIPLPQLPARVDELDSNADMVVFCRSGVRSANAIMFLQQSGFNKLRNLKGGILAWAEQVDPSMPTY